MHVSEEERITDDRKPPPAAKPKANPRLLAGIAVAIVAVLVLLYFLLKPEPPVEIVTIEEKPVQQQQQPEPVAPNIPVREPEEPEFVLPPLDQSDPSFRERLINLSPEMAPWLQTDELIRRSVSFTDGLSRGQLLTKLISIPPPDGKFQVEQQGGKLYLDQENFRRYDYLVNIVDAIDAEDMAELFDLYRPLLEKAYGELGYPPNTLGSNIIKALNQILSVPVIRGPIELEHESVYYTFANPKLEQLSALQKQLLRMGPQATQTIQEKAKILKQQLLETAANDSVDEAKQ